MKADRRRTLVNIVLLVVIVGAFAGLAWAYLVRYDRFTRDNVHAFVSSFGPWAPIAYGVIYVISSPIPFLAPVLSPAGGLLFGAVRGTIYTMVIATISSFVPFTMARRLGRDWVEKKLRGKRLDDIYQQSEGKKAFVFVMLLRLIPVLPWEVQNYVAGLTKVTPLTYAAGTIIGIIPGTFSLAFLGAAATRPGSGEFYLAIALKIVTGLLPAAVALVRRQLSRGREETLQATVPSGSGPSDAKD